MVDAVSCLTGFMGVYTTYSTLHLEGLKLLKAGVKRTWFVYTMLSYTCGILLAFTGYYI